jgi:hypothetical protein
MAVQVENGKTVAAVTTVLFYILSLAAMKKL